MHSFCRSFLRVLVFCTYLSAGEKPVRASAIDLPVEPFSSHDKRTADVFEDLAHHAHVAIGISGFVIADRKAKERTISIDVDGQSLREVLDEICSKDPDYHWREFSDRSIDVRRGSRPLLLIDVPVANLSAQDVRAKDVLGLLLQLPEVKRWEHATGCQVGHAMVINGNPQPDNGWRANLKVNEEPLWKVLNELSVESQTYFWSAVASAGDSCYVFLDVLDGN